MLLRPEVGQGAVAGSGLHSISNALAGPLRVFLEGADPSSGTPTCFSGLQHHHLHVLGPLVFVEIASRRGSSDARADDDNVGFIWQV